MHQQQNHQPHQPAMTPSGTPVFHIGSLNPYQNRWTIMARVTQKSDIKTWSKAGGNEGKLFSMTLMDESVSRYFFFMMQRVWQQMEF